MDQSIGSALDDLCITENGRIGRKRRASRDGNEPFFKSKNLVAERNRRQKLHDRLMELRGVVPNITNMKKATIIEDAIVHIKNLEEAFDDLKNQLLDLEASSEEGTDPNKGKIQERIKEPHIQLNVSLVQIFENKFWMKVIFEQKPCVFTKFMEALSALGFEVTDSTLTTCNGAMLVTTTVEGFHYESLPVEEIKALLQEILKGHLI